MIPENHKKLFDHVPPGQRSTLTNEFLGAVRAGATTPDAVIRAVLDTLRVRARDASRWGDEEDQRKITERHLALTLHPEEARDFARWALDWAALPIEERERRKREEAARHIDTWMGTQRPTAKQLACLRELGHRGPVESRRHASTLIGRHIGRRS